MQPPFETTQFYCPSYAPILDFNPQEYFPEDKLLRFMNREAQLAVVAARLAMEDAEIRTGQTYSEDDIALYGSTGVAGMTIEDMSQIIRLAAHEDGSLDLHNFGQVALKRIRPVLSFKILANMPICFVSIYQNIKGPNAVYTPWEGHGAQAMISGIRAIRRGDVSCALVGGCDVKTRELSFINLNQLGIFESWKRRGNGCIPGEGAVFLVLEDEGTAIKRGKKAYARVIDYQMRSSWGQSRLDETLYALLSELKVNRNPVQVVASGDGDANFSDAEKTAMERAGFPLNNFLNTKSSMGNLFAAAASAQCAVAAQLTKQQNDRQPILANCFGYGTEQASFVLEPSCIES
jgi:3-oxoacyl-(acyl-carrier-protein) synthase